VCIVLLISPAVFAQKIDRSISFRSIESDRYFRFHYDNDYFAATDENYTQGYNFELVLPLFKKNPLNALFFNFYAEKTRYGLAVEHIGFTPNHYELPEIQFGDRPFAAAIMLKSFKIATNASESSRFVSSFNLGIIGPGAFGEEMQVGIHDLSGNKTPRGWRHQIQNDVVINYELGYERQLFQWYDLLSLQAQSHLKVGTLFTNASVGANAVFGVFNSPFSSEAKSRKFQIYAYAQPIITVVGYDATLQGGLFNTKSPYTISTNHVERLTAQFNYGIVLKTKTLYLEYTRSSISKEFGTGAAANWGGIKVGFTI